MSQQITFTFNKADDDRTPTEQLHYTCYKAPVDISTLELIDRFGIFVTDGTDVNTFTIPNLGELEPVYFNVVVRDLAGRRTAYAGASTITEPNTEVQFLSENTFLTSVQSTQLAWIANQPVSFESYDPSIATVSSAGVVTGVSEGTATITITADGVSDTLIIAVDTYDFTPLEEATIQTFTTQ